MMSARGIPLRDLRKTLEHYDGSWKDDTNRELRIVCNLRYREYLHAICDIDGREKYIAVKGVWLLPTIRRIRGDEATASTDEAP